MSHRSTRQRIKSPMQGVDVSQAGRSSGRLELWTPQSMLEPILMPASATQRLAAAKAPPLKSISKRLIETGNARRWEDGPGRRFWEVQEKNLKAAVARTQAMQRQASAAAGSAWQQKHDLMVASRVAKHHEAAAQALQRKEYYPRARVFAEARQREEMKSAWEQREHARLRMGMDPAARRAEATAVADETSLFEHRLQHIHLKKTEPRRSAFATPSQFESNIKV